MPTGINPVGTLLWRRPIDSFAPRKLTGYLAGLTIYLARFPSTRSLRPAAVLRVGRVHKTKSPLAFSQRALGSGDVLLSHGLSP
jgi:hypothetical protein